MSESRTFTERGGWWVVAQFIFIPLGVVASIAASGPPSAGIVQIALRVLAAILAVTGVVVVALGVAGLGANLTAFPRPVASGFLVRSGAYGVVRHPIYTGIILLLAAVACLFDSMLGAFVTACVFVFFDLKSDLEEAWLAEKFADYGDYQRQVRKLVPWLY